MRFFLSLVILLVMLGIINSVHDISFVFSTSEVFIIVWILSSRLTFDLIHKLLK